MEVKFLLVGSNITAKAFNLGLQVVYFSTKTAYLAIFISQSEVHILEAFGALFFVYRAVKLICFAIFGLADALNIFFLELNFVNFNFFNKFVRFKVSAPIRLFLWGQEAIDCDFIFIFIVSSASNLVALCAEPQRAVEGMVIVLENP